MTDTTTPAPCDLKEDNQEPELRPLSYEEWLRFRTSDDFNYNRWNIYQDDI